MSAADLPDREALETFLLGVEVATDDHGDGATLTEGPARRLADALLAAGWSRSPRPATEAACRQCGREWAAPACGMGHAMKAHELGIVSRTFEEDEAFTAARPATVSEAAAHLDASLTALKVTDEERDQYCRWAKSAAAVNMSPAVYELAFKIAASKQLTRQDLDRLGEQGVALPHLAAQSVTPRPEQDAKAEAWAEGVADADAAWKNAMTLSITGRESITNPYRAAALDSEDGGEERG